MLRIHRRLLAALVTPVLFGATLVATVTPAAAAVPIDGFTITQSSATTVFGESFTLTATLTGTGAAPTGTVDFFAGESLICGARPLSGASPTATATCLTAGLSIGTHSITASYSGDVTYSPAASTTFAAATSHVVGLASTTTGLASSLNPSPVSAPVTLTATVTPTSPAGGSPSGTVAFRDNGVDITGCATQPVSSGVATCSTTNLTIGSHPISALYAGSASYVPSPSATTTQVVTKADSTVAVTSNHEPTLAGQSVTFTATVAAADTATGTPTGTVAFFAVRDDLSRTWIATETISAGVATATTTQLPLDTQRISAVYRASATFVGSEVTADQAVVRGATTTTVISTRSPAIAGRFIAFVATVSPTVPGADPSGDVAFFRIRSDSSRAFLGTDRLDDGRARLRTDRLPVGQYPIVAVYRASLHHTTSTGSTTQRITH